MSGQTLQDNPEEMETEPPPTEQLPTTEVPQLPVDNRSVIELSSTSESCGAYFTREMETLGAGDSFTCGQGKTSVSDPISVTHGLNVQYC